MKYAFTFIVILVTLLGSTMIMAQTSDCQKKCTDAFIKCSGTCASSADASCGAFFLAIGGLSHDHRRPE
ncbi:MAG TPA: hypothetical protein PLL11_13235, partial [Spirochaetota bacterium]|nr:hypothetical protein [Spirochaetota bacterium]